MKPTISPDDEFKAALTRCEGIESDLAKERKLLSDAFTDELKGVLDNAEAIEASLIKEAKLLRDSADELHAFQKTIDLSDFAQVQRMTRLLTIAQVGNVRRTHRHQEKEI